MPLSASEAVLPLFETALTSSTNNYSGQHDPGARKQDVCVPKRLRGYFSAHRAQVIQRQCSKDVLTEWQLTAELDVEAYFKNKDITEKGSNDLCSLSTKPEAYLALFNTHWSRKSLTAKEAECIKVEQTKETKNTESLNEYFPSSSHNPLSCLSPYEVYIFYFIHLVLPCNMKLYVWMYLYLFIYTIYIQNILKKHIGWHKQKFC